MTKSKLLKPLAVVVTLSVAALTSCAPTLYTPTQLNAATAEEVALLAKGRQLYIDRCNECHSLSSPKRYNATEWKGVLDHMAPKAKLTSDEYSQVYKYLTSVK